MRESVVIDLIPVNVKDLRSRRSLICHLDARRSRWPRAHRSVRWALVYTGYAEGTELTILDLCCITDYNPPRLAISAWTRLLFGRGYFSEHRDAGATQAGGRAIRGSRRIVRSLGVL